MNETKKEYYRIIIKDKNDKKLFEGIILDGKEDNIYSHKYYFCFTDTEDIPKLYRIKSLKDFLIIITQEDYKYEIEQVKEMNLDKIISDKKSKISNYDNILKYDDILYNKICDYLNSANEKYIYDKEKKLNDGLVK